MNVRFNHDDEKTDHEQKRNVLTKQNEILESFKMLIETSITLATYGFGLLYCNLAPQYRQLSG